MADRTKDIKSENKPLYLAIRRSTVNSERGTSELVTTEARLQDIWSEIVVKTPSLWVALTYARNLTRREQRTILLEAIDRAGLKAHGKDPPRGTELSNAQEKQNT